jgi:membrane-bound lytic murein transglycosylase B
MTPGIVDSSSNVIKLKEAAYEEKYEILVEFLEEAGFSREITKLLFLDSRIEYFPNLVLTKIPESNEDFLNQYDYSEITKLRTREFITTYREDLIKAENQFGVHKETIAAIIYVETKFGHVTGTHRIFNVLSSIALADQEFALKELRQEIKNRYQGHTTIKIENLISYYEKYAKKRALMARFELAHLMEMYVNANYNIMELRGSYAGAFGYCQFMPSSYIQYAMDGDGDNKIDLFNYHDAIFSIANYLKDKGWENNYYAKRRALLRYNYSRKYVSDVFQAAANIKLIAENI